MVWNSEAESNPFSVQHDPHFTRNRQLLVVNRTGNVFSFCYGQTKDTVFKKGSRLAPFFGAKKYPNSFQISWDYWCTSVSGLASFYSMPKFSFWQWRQVCTRALRRHTAEVMWRPSFWLVRGLHFASEPIFVAGRVSFFLLLVDMGSKRSSNSHTLEAIKHDIRVDRSFLAQKELGTIMTQKNDDSYLALKIIALRGDEEATIRAITPQKTKPILRRPSLLSLWQRCRFVQWGLLLPNWSQLVLLDHENWFGTSILLIGAGGKFSGGADIGSMQKTKPTGKLQGSQLSLSLLLLQLERSQFFFRASFSMGSLVLSVPGPSLEICCLGFLGLFRDINTSLISDIRQ